jgi:hypothetical protein
MLVPAGIAAIFCRYRDDPAAANPAIPLLTLRWTFPGTDSKPAGLPACSSLPSAPSGATIAMIMTSTGLQQSLLGIGAVQPLHP